MPSLAHISTDRNQAATGQTILPHLLALSWKKSWQPNYSIIFTFLSYFIVAPSGFWKYYKENNAVINLVQLHCLQTNWPFFYQYHEMHVHQSLVFYAVLIFSWFLDLLLYLSCSHKRLYFLQSAESSNATMLPVQWDHFHVIKTHRSATPPESPLRPRLGARASSSSKNMTHGEAVRALANTDHEYTKRQAKKRNINLEWKEGTFRIIQGALLAMFYFVCIYSGLLTWLLAPILTPRVTLDSNK